MGGKKRLGEEDVGREGGVETEEDVGTEEDEEDVAREDIGTERDIRAGRASGRA
ncbi:hypothetical protein [Streptoalloteichus tenebrarius]|uniref:hypothetical protein n=1 Tax=Streptoalloteichus tenebrarius (strain ATCC 17920 / DSM 40477 / JCM 4838 / CBS 697.72 / NBRC 16177 / NCIMB 11028 / NRRL B-12390 / A12253. 1 / ISP 5477) TaxID=1933 RepID=UPI0020A3F931|nr:hypothetical protein [Streptoalloteichus tenebrarius]